MTSPHRRARTADTSPTTKSNKQLAPFEPILPDLLIDSSFSIVNDDKQIHGSLSGVRVTASILQNVIESHVDDDDIRFSIYVRSLIIPALSLARGPDGLPDIIPSFLYSKVTESLESKLPPNILREFLLIIERRYGQSVEVVDGIPVEDYISILSSVYASCKLRSSHARIPIPPLKDLLPHACEVFSFGTQVIQFDGHDKAVTAIAVGSRGVGMGSSVIITSSNDGSIRGWDSVSAQCLWEQDLTRPIGLEVSSLVCFTGGVGSAATSAGVRCLRVHGKIVYAGCSDGSIRSLSITDGTIMAEMKGHSHWINDLEYVEYSNGANDGKVIQAIISASQDGTLRSWNVSTSTCLLVLGGHAKAVTCVCTGTLPHGTYGSPFVVSGSVDTTARLWDVAAGECVQIFRGHSGEVRSIAIHGSLVFTGSTDRSFRCFQVESGECLLILDSMSSPVTLTRLQPVCVKGGGLVMSGSIDRSLGAWDIKASDFLKSDASTAFCIGIDSTFYVGRANGTVLGFSYHAKGSLQARDHFTKNVNVIKEVVPIPKLDVYRIRNLPVIAKPGSLPPLPDHPSSPPKRHSPSHALRHPKPVADGGRGDLSHRSTGSLRTEVEDLRVALENAKADLISEKRRNSESSKRYESSIRERDDNIRVKVEEEISNFISEWQAEKMNEVKRAVSQTRQECEMEYNKKKDWMEERDRALMDDFATVDSQLKSLREENASLAAALEETRATFKRKLNAWDNHLLDEQESQRMLVDARVAAEEKLELCRQSFQDEMKTLVAHVTEMKALLDKEGALRQELVREKRRLEADVNALRSQLSSDLESVATNFTIDFDKLVLKGCVHLTSGATDEMDVRLKSSVWDRLMTSRSAYELFVDRCASVCEDSFDCHGGEATMEALSVCVAQERRRARANLITWFLWLEVHTTKEKLLDAERAAAEIDIIRSAYRHDLSDRSGGQDFRAVIEDLQKQLVTERRRREDIESLLSQTPKIPVAVPRASESPISNSRGDVDRLNAECDRLRNRLLEESHARSDLASQVYNLTQDKLAMTNEISEARSSSWHMAAAREDIRRAERERDGAHIQLKRAQTELASVIDGALTFEKLAQQFMEDCRRDFQNELDMWKTDVRAESLGLLAVALGSPKKSENQNASSDPVRDQSLRLPSPPPPLVKAALPPVSGNSTTETKRAEQISEAAQRTSLALTFIDAKLSASNVAMPPNAVTGTSEMGVRDSRNRSEPLVEVTPAMPEVKQKSPIVSQSQSEVRSTTGLQQEAVTPSIVISADSPRDADGSARRISTSVIKKDAPATRPPSTSVIQKETVIPTKTKPSDSVGETTRPVLTLVTQKEVLVTRPSSTSVTQENIAPSKATPKDSRDVADEPAPPPSTSVARNEVFATAPISKTVAQKSLSSTGQSSMVPKSSVADVVSVVQKLQLFRDVARERHSSSSEIKIEPSSAVQPEPEPRVLFSFDFTKSSDPVVNHVRLIQCQIETVLGRYIKSGEVIEAGDGSLQPEGHSRWLTIPEFLVAIHDGILLCRVLKRVDLNFVARVISKPLPLPPMQRHINVTSFVNHVATLGLKAFEIFPASALLETPDLHLILKTLETLFSLEIFQCSFRVLRYAGIKKSGVFGRGSVTPIPSLPPADTWPAASKQ